MIFHLSDFVRSKNNFAYSAPMRLCTVRDIVKKNCGGLYTPLFIIYGDVNEIFKGLGEIRLRNSLNKVNRFAVI